MARDLVADVARMNAGRLPVGSDGPSTSDRDERCPTCGAGEGSACTTPEGVPTGTHLARRLRAAA